MTTRLKRESGYYFAVPNTCKTIVRYTRETNTWLIIGSSVQYLTQDFEWIDSPKNRIELPSKTGPMRLLRYPIKGVKELHQWK